MSTDYFLTCERITQSIRVFLYVSLWLHCPLSVKILHHTLLYAKHEYKTRHFNIKYYIRAIWDWDIRTSSSFMQIVDDIVIMIQLSCHAVPDKVTVACLTYYSKQTFGPGSMSFCLILTVVSMNPEQLPMRSG